jgi:N-formylglutamate amidohydrolase
VGGRHSVVLRSAIAIALPLVASLLLLPALAVRGQTGALVWAVAGALPVILTAPHGGGAEIPGVPRRTSGTTTQDARTLEVAEAVAQRLEDRFCQRPYMVGALFHRRYADANRPEGDAFQDPAAGVHYAAYHDAIRAYVAEMRQRFPGGAILINVHGQAEEPGVIHRGTGNGRTMARSIAHFGEGAVIGDTSIFGRLQALGYPVFPPNTPIGNPSEHPRYAGGFTVRTYGSHHATGIDALQIEIGADFRRPPAVGPLSDDLADAIGTYYTAVLGGAAQCPASLAPALPARLPGMLQDNWVGDRVENVAAVPRVR